MLRIHPSSAWTGLTCPESLREVEGATDEHSIYADFGRAGHSVMRHVGERGLSELPDLSEWIERFNIEDVEGFEAACRFAMKRWLKLREFFPAPEFEKKNGAFFGDALWRIEGTEDVCSRSGNRVDILDWKMGHKEHVGRWQIQMQLYLFAEFQTVRLCHPEVEPMEGSATVVFFGDGTHTTWQWSEQDVADFASEFNRDAVERLGKFVPGPHCEWCARGRVPSEDPLHCAKGHEAWGTFIEAVVSSTLPAVRGETAVARAELVRVFEMAKAVERGSKSFLAKVRTYLEAQPGQRIELGDGRFLGFKKVVKRQVKPIEGIAVFERWLEDEDLAAAVKLSKSTAIGLAKDALAATDPGQPRGWKAALEREINAALEGAGAFAEREEYHMGIYEKEPGDGKGEEAGQIPAAGE